MQRKALVMDISFHAAPLGNLEEDLFNGDFDRWMNGALQVGNLSLRELCEGNLDGGSFNGNAGGCVKGPCWGAGGSSTGT